MANAAPAPAPRTFASFREIADFLWQNAERLRGAYKPNEYDKVILPLLVLRRLDCVLAPTKDKVLARLAALEAKGMKATDPAVDVALRKVAGVAFYNTSKLDFAKLKGDPNHIAPNLRAYLKGFSPNARDVLEQFSFDREIARLDDHDLLFQVLSLFADVNLHPDAVPNHVMGSVFEELIRRFNRASGSTAEGIRADRLRASMVVVPPLEEQQAIVSEVTRQLASLEPIAALITTQLDRLREYRQALITAAVTGKLDLTAEPVDADRALATLDAAP